MLKFFRQLRQRLFSENKFSKYLLYALGEIVLVMIGILLALQANQWKEQRIGKELEQKLIKEIQNGLKSDLADVKINFQFHQKILNNQYKVINWLENDLEFNDSISYQFSMSTKISSFLVTTAPFESLKEFGLNRISNDSIKHNIIKLYDVLYPQYKEGLDMYYAQNERLYDVAFKYFDNWNLNPNFFGNNPIHIPQLQEDHEVLMRFKYLNNNNRYLVRTNAEMKQLLTETIHLIELELNP